MNFTLPEGILEVIRSLYPIAQEATFLEATTKGYLSRNFVLQTPRKKLFLKEYSHSKRNKIEEIHKIEIFFATRGVPIILPYVSEEQTTIFAYSERFYALFPFVDGKTVERSERSAKAHAATGSMLARIHLAGREDHADIDVPEQKAWNREVFFKEAAVIEEKISTLTTLSEYDQLALRSLELKQGLARVNPIEPEMLGIQNDHLLHGDYHESNIFYNEHDEVNHVFDLENACLGPRAFEVARSIDFMCFAPEYKEEGFEIAQHFLRAYDAIYPLPKEELVQGIMKYYLTRAHSLWHVTEHYLLQNFRVDVFFKDETQMLEYYSQNLETHLDRLTSLY